MELECDVQGVLRGRCNRCGHCRYYRTPPPPALYCAACHHPPGLHQNMGQRPPPPQQLPSVAGAQPSSKGSAQTAPSGATGASGRSYSGTPYSAGTGYAQSGSGYPHTIQAQQPSLKTCKSSGCSKLVYYDEYGVFDYCSPRCRDAHLLESEREKLQRDIDKYTKQPRPSTLPTSGSGGGYDPFVSSSTLPASGASNSQQDRSDAMRNLTKVTIRKNPGIDVGIIVKNSLSFSPAADRPAFLITGVVTESPAHSFFKEGKLKLFGLITRVSDKDAKKFDESFNDFTRRLDTVELHVDMSNATTPFPSGTYGCTHVIGIKYESTTEDIGIEFQDSPNGVVVEKVKTGKVPELSGVCSRDIILPRPGNDASGTMVYLTQCLETGKAVILCIKRKVL